MLIQEIGEPTELEFLMGERLTNLLIDLTNGICVYLGGGPRKNPKPPFGKSKKQKTKEVKTQEVPDGKGGIKYVKVVN